MDSILEIRQELNDNLRNGMSREEAYAIYNERAAQYMKKHQFAGSFGFLYPEILTKSN